VHGLEKISRHTGAFHQRRHEDEHRYCNQHILAHEAVDATADKAQHDRAEHEQANGHRDRASDEGQRQTHHQQNGDGEDYQECEKTDIQV